jgi:hypothetical protein
MVILARALKMPALHNVQGERPAKPDRSSLLLAASSEEQTPAEVWDSVYRSARQTLTF